MSDVLRDVRKPAERNMANACDYGFNGVVTVNEAILNLPPVPVPDLPRSLVNLAKVSCEEFTVDEEAERCRAACVSLFEAMVLCHCPDTDPALMAGLRQLSKQGLDYAGTAILAFAEKRENVRLFLENVVDVAARLTRQAPSPRASDIIGLEAAVNQAKGALEAFLEVYIHSQAIVKLYLVPDAIRTMNSSRVTAYTSQVLEAAASGPLCALDTVVTTVLALIAHYRIRTGVFDAGVGIPTAPERCFLMTNEQYALQIQIAAAAIHLSALEARALVVEI
jgi:hypothetical protein